MFNSEIVIILKKIFFYIFHFSEKTLFLLPLLGMVREPIINIFSKNKMLENKLKFISDQIQKRRGSQDSKMICHLELERDSLQLQVTQGISAPGNLVRALVSISEDYPGGVSWRVIKRARQSIFLNDKGQLEVRLSLSDRIKYFFYLFIEAVAKCSFRLLLLNKEKVGMRIPDGE